MRTDFLFKVPGILVPSKWRNSVEGAQCVMVDIGCSKCFSTFCRNIVIILQESANLAYDAGRVISQAITNMSKERDWVALPNGSSLYGPDQERERLLEALRNVRA